MPSPPLRLSRAKTPVTVSFEFFPPKSEEMEAQLWEAIGRLAPLGPAFVSVTYGAGGSTRRRTHATVERVARETAVKPAAHLTCCGASKSEIDAIVREYFDAGVRHIVALRGDSPAGPDAPYVAHPEGYQRTEDLVAAIKRAGDFEVSVSAYPERHPQSPTLIPRRRGAEAQDRRGRRPRHHPVLFRQLRLLPLSRRRRRGGDRNPDRAWHRAGAEF